MPPVAPPRLAFQPPVDLHYGRREGYKQLRTSGGDEAMDALRSVGALLGRFMLAFIFVAAGFEKVLGPGGTMQYMASAGMPKSLIPELFVVTVIVELIGGLLLIAGWHARLVAFIMFLWFIPVTIMFHVIPGQTIEWEKNLAIMGGLLLVAVHGPGAFSIDSARATSPDGRLGPK
jgi:putative oxidoreductase